MGKSDNAIDFLGPNRKLTDLAGRIVSIGWMMRLTRELRAANAVGEPDFSEKAFISLLLLQKTKQMTATALARVLRLSTERARDSLRHILAEGLVTALDADGNAVDSGASDSKPHAYRLTKQGETRLREMLAESAQTFTMLLGFVGLTDEELQPVEHVVHRVGQAVDAIVDRFVVRS